MGMGMGIGAQPWTRDPDSASGCSLRSPRTGRPATSTFASAITCFRPHQKWTITAVTNAGGYLGSPYFKITIAGTDRTLAATAEGEVVAVPAFTGQPEQLWRIDQLTDGTYRIMPKAVPDSKRSPGTDRGGR